MFTFIAVITLALLFFSLRYIEPKMIYFPMPFPQGYWDTSQFPGQIEDCTFQTGDGVTLHGWFAHAVNPGNEPAPTLLFFHGNAGNLSHRLTNIASLMQLGANVFIFDYRGYGKSEGKPDEQGLYTDAAAAYQYLWARADVNKDRIIFFGRSLGGAVAVELATKKSCDRLILEATFTSAKDMVLEMFNGLPIHFLIRSKFDSLSKIKSIHVPLFLIHGNLDAVVPIEQGKRLFAEANEPKYFYEIEGADHNNTFDVGGNTYFERFARFIHSDFSL